MDFEAFPLILSLKASIRKKTPKIFDFNKRTLGKKTTQGWHGLTSCYYYGVKPWNGTFVFKFSSKGDQLKVKLASIFAKSETLVLWLGRVRKKRQGMSLSGLSIVDIRSLLAGPATATVECPVVIREVAIPLAKCWLAKILCKISLGLFCSWKVDAEFTHLFLFFIVFIHPNSSCFPWKSTASEHLQPGDAASRTLRLPLQRLHEFLEW